MKIIQLHSTDPTPSMPKLKRELLQHPYITSKGRGNLSLSKKINAMTGRGGF